VSSFIFVLLIHCEYQTGPLRWNASVAAGCPLA
jgi:hypothetical protein